MNSRYVGRDGQILRRSRVSLKDFSCRRLSIIFGTCILLLVSNPGNNNIFSWSNIGMRTSSSSTSASSSSSSRRRNNNLGTYKLEWLGIEINISDISSASTNVKERVKSAYNKYGNGRHSTNFILYSLSKETNGVDIGILYHSFPICKYNGRSPSFCHWISDNLCHETQFWNKSNSNKAFTMLRIMQILKITSFLLQKCYISNNIPLFPKITLRHVLYNPFSLLSSIFHETNSIKDFVSFNIYLYPALELLERITTISASNDIDAAFQFYGISFILIFIMGGIANLLAAYLLNDSTGGMKGSIAACLGFITAVNPKAIVLDQFDVRLTAGDALLSTFAITFVSAILGFTSIATGEWEIGNIVSWAFGGLLGYGIGEYQKEKLGPWLHYLFSLTH